MPTNNPWVLVSTTVVTPISQFDGSCLALGNCRTEFRHVADYNLRVVIDLVGLDEITAEFEVNMLHRERGRLGGFRIIAVVGQTTYNEVIKKALQGC